MRAVPVRSMQRKSGDRYIRGLSILPNQIGMIAVGAEHQCAAIVCDLPLAIQIILECGVFDGADVVRGNIEECPSIERQAIHALHFVCLGGDFHHQIPHAVIRGFAHHAESVHRLGRGQVRFCICVAVQAIVHRREQCGPAAGIGVEHGLHKIGGGRLALGAGDTDDGQLILRATIELSGQQAHGLTRIIDDQSSGAGDGGILGFGHVCGKSGLIDVRQVIRLEPALAA